MRFLPAEFGTISGQYFEGSVFGRRLSVTGVGGKSVLDSACVLSLRFLRAVAVTVTVISGASSSLH